MVCPKCGSETVLVQQVQMGEKSKTKTNEYVTRHGIMYWLFFGWWISISKWLWRGFLFLSTLGFSALFRRKKKIGMSKGKTVTKIQNKTIATCQNCGNSWKV